MTNPLPHELHPQFYIYQCCAPEDISITSVYMFSHSCSGIRATGIDRRQLGAEHRFSCERASGCDYEFLLRLPPF